MPLLTPQQIADAVRASVTEGYYRAGELLPSVQALAERWGAGQGIVLRAMDVLRADGVVRAREGEGYGVVEHAVARPAGRRDTSRVTGAAAYHLLGAPAKEVPPGLVAAALDLTTDERALRRTRLLLLPDGSPYTLVDAWFPPAVTARCPRLAEPAPP